MALINQNSIIGITSITSPSASNVLTVHTNDTTERLRVSTSGLSFSGTNASLDTSGNISAVDGTFTGNVSIGGTLTYEDVTNIDSVGIITAQSDVSIADKIIHTGDTDTAIRFPAADTFTVETAGSEKLRINSSGRVGIGTNIPTALLHLKSNAPYITFEDDDNNQDWQIQATAWFAIRDQTNNAERLRITSSGDIGIGTLDAPGPVSLFHVQKGNVTNQGKWSDCAVALDNRTNVGSYSQFGFGYTYQTTYASAYLGYISTNQGSKGYGDIVFGTRSVNSDTQPTERLRITSAGNIGIGENSPDVRLHVKETINTAYSLTNVANEANHILKLENASTTANAFSGMQFRVGSGADLFFGAIQQSTNHGDFFFANQNSPQKEMMRIKSTGLVGIGTDNPTLTAGNGVHIAGGNAALKLQNTNNGDWAFIEYADESNTTKYVQGYRDSSGMYAIRPGTSLNATPGITLDSNGNVGIGVNPEARLHVEENLSHSSTYYLNGDAHILVDNPGSGKSVLKLEGEAAIVYGGGSSNLIFADRQNERLRIRSNGDLILGPYDAPGSYTTAANNVPYQIKVAPYGWQHHSEIAAISMGNHSGANGNDDGEIVFKTTQNAHSSTTGLVERVRITSIGQVLMGRTSAYNGGPGETCVMQGDRHGLVIFQSANANYTGINIRNTYANNNSNNVSGNMITFHDQGGSERGKIAINGSTTSYISPSDYRLKENVVAMLDGITRLNQLKPSRFNWIEHPGTIVDGFIAHEVTPAVPEAVDGQKDAVDENDKPVYQGVDNSKIVPLLTAALQEAIAKIEILESKVASLEGS